MRLGAIGKPSGLIASEADAAKLKAASGMEIVDLTLDELVDEYHKGGYPENNLTLELKSQGYAPEEIEKALNVYGAVWRMMERYNLQAVTVRCFELLSLIQTTGCLALAILNAQGIPAACEGDTKSLASMVILNAITGQSSFMANPSCMDTETQEIIFAHCTLPIDMPERYRLTTHFESGIGVAVAGEVSLGDVTVFKCNDTLTRHYAGYAELLECPDRADLCRTQMRLRMIDGVDYFARGPDQQSSHDREGQLGQRDRRIFLLTGQFTDQAPVLRRKRQAKQRNEYQKDASSRMIAGVFLLINIFSVIYKVEMHEHDAPAAVRMKQTLPVCKPGHLARRLYSSAFLTDCEFDGKTAEYSPGGEILKQNRVFMHI